MGKIICGYSGVGKSVAAKLYPKTVIDLESSVYNKEDANWPKYYVDHIIDASKENEYVLCSCHEEVRMELCKRGIGFVIVAPKDDLLYEYSKRWFIRGSSLEFIKKMQEQWSFMHQSIFKHGNSKNVVVILLSHGEYLSDIIGGEHIDKKRRTSKKTV